MMMARAPAMSLALLALLPATAGAAGAFEHRPLGAASAQGGSRFVPGEVIVRFRAGAQAEVRAAALSRSGARASSSLGSRGLRLVRLRRGQSVRAAAARLARSAQVLYAQPNYRYRLATVPNDPRFGELWGLANAGQPVQGTAGTADADVDATDAWSVTTGRPSTTVAIADSGVAYDHPDLAPNLWRNRGESGRGRETNGRDDDHNGFVDDWRGWDFVDRDNDPRDLNGHGTHVAGIAGARGNNAFGGAGVSWQLSLMALRVADADGVVSDASIVRGFDYAAANGARVVNASFVSPAYSDILREAIRRHPKVLFVAAAGNGDPDGIGDDNDSSPQYPCSFNLVNLLCVAASDQADRLASFSNFGRTAVDLAAPGASVLSTLPAYATLFGNGFETELAGTWETGGINNTWGRTQIVANSGSFSLSDSPGAEYQNGTDSFVRSAAPVSLAGQHGCRVEYALRLNTETGIDRLLFEVSTDGASWTAVSDSSGTSQGAFVGVFDDISRLDGAGAVWLRFHLTTNGSVVGDGAQIDDVAVRCLSATYTGAELGFNDGTSMAAPHVTGTAALLLSRYKDLGVAALAQAIKRGVDAKAAMAGKLASGGRLNVLRGLREGGRLLPKLKLSGVSRQRAARKGSIVLFARCSRRCTAAGGGSLTFGRASKGPRLKRALRAIGARKRKRLVLKLSRTGRARVQRALARGRRVSARVTVIATDSLGSTAHAKRTVRIGR
jgi:subtilisin family serine protease